LFIGSVFEDLDRIQLPVALAGQNIQPQPAQTHGRKAYDQLSANCRAVEKNGLIVIVSFAIEKAQFKVKNGLAVDYVLFKNNTVRIRGLGK